MSLGHETGAGQEPALTDDCFYEGFFVKAERSWWNLRPRLDRNRLQG